MDRISQKKAIQYGKRKIKEHEAYGVFSTEYYIYLFDRYVEEFQKRFLHG